MKAATRIALAAIIASCTARAAEEPRRELLVLEYCDLPETRCSPRSDASAEIQAQLAELFWCCPYGGECYHVASANLCDPDAEYLVWCEWGRSTPASTSTGSGIECFV